MTATLNSELVPQLRAATVVPVLTIGDAEAAVPLARALAAGGLGVIEVTLRTPAALGAIRRIGAEVPEAMVGAGTVLTAADGEAAIAAGSRFLVSPGAMPRLLDAAETWPVPLLPGCATASEAMILLDRGYRVAKLFPAEQAGGVKLLQALAAPLPALSFCPTGGIGPANAAEYLALPNVVCVGGSWVAPKDAVASGDWAAITRLSAAALALRRR